MLWGWILHSSFSQEKPEFSQETKKVLGPDPNNIFFLKISIELIAYLACVVEKKTKE